MIQVLVLIGFLNLQESKEFLLFDEKQFLANPQAYMGRGSVEQQMYLQNLLYGTPMNVGGPIEQEEEEVVGTNNSSMIGFGF